MKKTFLFLSLITVTILAAAQSNDIVKLKKELNDHTQQDTFRVNRLNDLAINPSFKSGQREKFGVVITVSDNGNGIPQNIVDKIFQPFFTTKPTGQGTGLGLSLSYDIIKAHGGEIKVETKEGKGSTFIIQLPNS